MTWHWQLATWGQVHATPFSLLLPRSLPFPPYLSKVLGRGAVVGLSLFLPPVQSLLFLPGSVPWEADLHRLPQPLASKGIIGLEAGAGEGEAGVPLPSSACHSVAFLAVASVPSSPRLEVLLLRLPDYWALSAPFLPLPV